MGFENLEEAGLMVAVHAGEDVEVVVGFEEMVVTSFTFVLGIGLEETVFYKY